MSDLFDLPFEDDDDIASQASQPSLPSQVPSRRILTVTELTVRVRDLLETEFFEVWVEGELSNCRLWNTGHLYFTLKDASAQLRGVVFRSALRYLKFKPEDGLRVVARGRLSVYEPKGEYQLVCDHLEPQGLGALQLAFDQLKKRLQDEGLFDAARKRPLPLLPRKIGIVTSLDGAAIRDIIKVLRRRYANAHLIIRPARVQGEGAALEVARGLRSVSRLPGVDVVIVGRGGALLRICGHSTKRSWHERSRSRPCRLSRPSDTRLTSPSPTSSQTFELQRPLQPPNWWSLERTSSAPVSIACGQGFRPALGDACSN